MYIYDYNIKLSYEKYRYCYKRLEEGNWTLPAQYQVYLHNDGIWKKPHEKLANTQNAVIWGSLIAIA